MRIQYLHSFDKDFSVLRPLDRTRVRHAIEAALDYLSASHAPPKGLGLKKLRSHFWEIRVGLKLRILFALEADCLTFILVGNHDDIRRALR